MVTVLTVAGFIFGTDTMVLLFSVMTLFWIFENRSGDEFPTSIMTHFFLLLRVFLRHIMSNV